MGLPMPAPHVDYMYTLFVTNQGYAGITLIYSQGQLWKIECVPKIKQFLWRFAHNSLPVRMNIARRGMDIDTRCPMCGRLDEDGGHCFLRCKKVRKCWQELNLEDIRLCLVALGSAREVVQEILKMRCGRQKLVISLLWAWWNGRNKANAGEVVASVQEISHKATLFSSDAEPMSIDDSNQGTARDRVVRRWLPPPADVLKINTDGAFIEKEKCGAWGFVIRDCDGHGILAGAGRFRAVYGALSTEGEACLAALQAALEAGISRIFIETDSS